MTGARVVFCWLGMSALAIGATPPAIPMSPPAGIRPVQFRNTGALIAGQRIGQPTIGECGSCGAAVERESFRPFLHRLIDFLCYRPLTGCCGRLEPTEYVPPLWSWFPGGVCHARAGCGSCVPCTESDAYLPGGGSADSPPMPTLPFQRPRKLVEYNDVTLPTPRLLRTFGDAPRPARSTAESGLLNTHRPRTPYSSIVVPSGFYVPSMKNLPISRHYSLPDADVPQPSGRGLPEMFPRR